MTRGKYHITWYNKKKRKTRLKCIGFPAQEFQYLINIAKFSSKKFSNKNSFKVAKIVVEAAINP